MRNLGLVLSVFLFLVILISASAFTVDQREYALVKRLGEVVAIEKTPGLYFKVPFVDKVVHFDNRILTLNWE